MCSWAYEREYWLRRVGKLEQEMRAAEERPQRERAPVATDPATPAAALAREPQPVPA